MNLWRRWVERLARREAATSLALCRIVVAVTVAWHLIDAWRSGVAATIWVDARWGGVQPISAWWLTPLGGATPGVIRGVIAVASVAALLLALGAFTRPATLGSWFLFDRLTRLNGSYTNSADRLIVNLLFLLLFSGCGRALSVDALWRRRRDDTPAWPRQLLMVQLGVMYFTSALQKISIGWIPGGPLDALWYILQQPTWQRRSMTWLAPLYPLTQAATLATWLFELLAPLFLLALYCRATADRPGRWRALLARRDPRPLYLGVGLLLHLAIFATLRIGPFLGAVLALYVCFVTPPEWAQVFARLARLARLARRRGDDGRPGAPGAAAPAA